MFAHLLSTMRPVVMKTPKKEKKKKECAAEAPRFTLNVRRYFKIFLDDMKYEAIAVNVFGLVNRRILQTAK